MLRRRFFYALFALAGFLPGASSAARASSARRSIPLQTSPVAGFQYHNGEAIWGEPFEGQTLDLIREAHNIHDYKAKLSARIAKLKDCRNPWERVRFEVLLEA